METAMLDLLDGIVVQNVRRARRAAKAAGRKIGNAAILKEFKLDKLYRTRADGPPAEEPDDNAPEEGQEKKGKIRGADGHKRLTRVPAASTNQCHEEVHHGHR
jgi:hypothetical protein